MTKPIRKVAVLGSGVMGGGIAAHLANAGVPVLLLDIVPPALDKLLKSKPAAFTHPRNARLITVGNLEKDLAKVRKLIEEHQDEVRAAWNKHFKR